jgi:PHD/YefM family antitoxin component YafN of YafNO toxin-antitoxin module
MKRVKAKVHHIPITEARTRLRQIARRAHEEKSYFVLEDHGEPVAGIMDVDELEDYLEVRDPEMRKQIAEGYQEYLRGELKEDAWEFLAELEREIEQPKRKRKRA